MDFTQEIDEIRRDSVVADKDLDSHDRTLSVSESYRSIRKQSETLCQPLQVEDYGVQTMADVSPPKWHLAHTSWFFETLILQPFLPGYRVYNPHFAYLFNSYYESLGEKHPRPQRGLLSRPSVDRVYNYRAYVDQAMLSLLAMVGHAQYQEIIRLTVLGLNHEQQHQELLLTDIKHILAYNPLPSVYREQGLARGGAVPLEWLSFDEGVYQIGRQTGEDLRDFCYDNETPRHKVYLAAFKIRNYPVLNGEYTEFIEAGAYQDPEYWLSDAWRCLREQGWTQPLYWTKQDGQWYHYTLNGIHKVDEYAPVCHVSFYEAAAFARWRGARLAREAEWEVAARQESRCGNFVDNGIFHPLADIATAGGDGAGVGVRTTGRLKKMYGDVWEWTQSPYAPYPGYKQSQGALGEYNGKFMSNQMVLRGGSCATPLLHIRDSYRNFFYPGDRWQFSGFRLVEDDK